MKIINTFLALVLLLLTNNLSAHGGSEHKHQTREQIAWQKIQKDAVLLDVRSPAEYSQQHLKNALNIPYKNIVEQLASLSINKEQSIVLYCRSGNRAGKALKALRGAGYKNLHNGGGINALTNTKP